MGPVPPAFGQACITLIPGFYCHTITPPHVGQRSVSSNAVRSAAKDLQELLPRS
jgi:hypothetical protein